MNFKQRAQTALKAYREALWPPTPKFERPPRKFRPKLYRPRNSPAFIGHPHSRVPWKLSRMRWGSR